MSRSTLCLREVSRVSKSTLRLREVSRVPRSTLRLREVSRNVKVHFVSEGSVT